MGLTLSITSGLVAGTLVAYLAAGKIVCHFVNRAQSPRLVLSLAVIGIAAMTPVAFVIAFLVGAHVGGGIGAAITEWLIGSSFGAMPGVGAGFGVVLAALIILGASVGAILGYGLSTRQ